MVKKLIALFLVVLMSIESFGAVVSDNDGSAFVTKSEFEALKSGFSEQVKNYNRSIDNRIDGAIAQYLAGFKVTNVTEVIQGSSILEYPIKIKMNNKANFDVTKWNDKTYTNLWRPEYNLLFANNRQGETIKKDFLYAGKYPSTFFVNLVYNSATSHWQVQNAYDVDKVVLNIQSMVIWRSSSGMTGFADNGTPQRVGVKIAPSSWVTSEGTGDYTIPLDDNYGLNWAVGQGLTTAPFIMGGYMAWNTTNPVRIADGTTFPNQKLSCATTNAGHAQQRTTWWDTYSDTISKTITPFNIIINQNSTYSDDYLFTMPNDKLYLTNNYYQTKVLLNTPVDSPCYKEGDATYHATCNKKFNLIIDGGFTIEPVGYGKTTRDKTLKSLWRTSDIYYEVKLPYTGDKVEQNLTKGILVTEMPDSEINWCSIELDVDLKEYDSLVDANLPKIVVSKSAIGDASVSTEQDKCYDLYDGRTLDESTKAKTKKLKSGKNIFYIKEPANKSKLYYKIYFNNNYTGSVIVKEPVVMVEAN